MMRQRYDLTPEGVALLDKVMGLLEGADIIDAANIGHAVLCWALSHLPEHRQQSIVAGLETSIPRALDNFAHAHAVREAKGEAKTARLH
jgi:hypothetical protein